MIETIGHHTCENKGNIQHVKNNAPFKSKYLPENNKVPFLGEGYYFWDYNIKMAHRWGWWQYKGNYLIVKGNLKWDYELTLDLVGNREHMHFFVQMMDKFSEANKSKRNQWVIGQFIEFLKELDKNERYHGIFPFRVIKAVDNKAINKQKTYDFVEDKKGGILLDPRIMICFIDKKCMRFNNRTVINPKKQ